MTCVFRRFAAVLLACLGFSAPASATVHSTDFTDIWYIPAESGWGVNFIQQGDVLFGTLFVYGEDKSARWYVASALVPQSAVSGTFVFKSPLYRTTGPWLGTTPFDAGTVTLEQVGEMTATFSSPTTGQLVYNVGTTTVTKSIVRQSFRGDAPTGNFLGGLSVVASACTSASSNGAVNIFGGVTITIAGNAVTLRLDYILNNGASASCTMNGTLATQGKLASITNGTWGCAAAGTTSTTGPFTITAVDTQVNGIHGTFSGSDQFCTYNGRIGGVRAVN